MDYSKFEVISENLEDRVIFKSSGSLTASNLQPAATVPIQTVNHDLSFGFPCLFVWSQSSSFDQSYPVTDNGFLYLGYQGLMVSAWCASDGLKFKIMDDLSTGRTVYWRCFGLLTGSQASDIAFNNTLSTYDYLINSEDGFPILVEEHSLSANTSVPHTLGEQPVCLAWFTNGSTYVQTGLMSNSSPDIMAVSSNSSEITFTQSGSTNTIAPYFTTAYVRLYPNA